VRRFLDDVGVAVRPAGNIANAGQAGVEARAARRPRRRRTRLRFLRSRGVACIPCRLIGVQDHVCCLGQVQTPLVGRDGQEVDAAASDYSTCRLVEAPQPGTKITTRHRHRKGMVDGRGGNQDRIGVSGPRAMMRSRDTLRPAVGSPSAWMAAISVAATACSFRFVCWLFQVSKAKAASSSRW